MLLADWLEQVGHGSRLVEVSGSRLMMLLVSCAINCMCCLAYVGVAAQLMCYCTNVRLAHGDIYVCYVLLTSFVCLMMMTTYVSFVCSYLAHVILSISVCYMTLLSLSCVNEVFYF